MHDTLIEQFASAGAALRRAVADLTHAEALARPGPGDPAAGAWSIQELVIHLADADAVAINRMKWVIAENNPPLPGFDENAWTRSLFNEAQSLEDAVTLFEVNRRQFARVLRQLSATAGAAAAFERFGTHSERGKVTLLDLLKTYTGHFDHHMTFLHAKRARLGKPVK